MKDPGQSIGGAPGGGAESGAKCRDITIENKDVKVLTPAYLEGLVAQKLEPIQLKSQLEKDFPGYTLPAEADIQRLNLRERHANLRQVAEGAEAQFNILFLNGDKFDRFRFAASGDSYTQREINSDEAGKPHLRKEDCLFLIKKTEAVKSPNS